MFDNLDDALREFLIRELPINDGEIDIAFDQPKREWSSRLSRPTLNVFLRDIRENVKLRSHSPGYDVAINGDHATLSRQGLYLDLYYMITAWATDPADEHRILARALAALLRYRYLPDEIVAQHAPELGSNVALRVAQYDDRGSPSDVWSVLDNEMRPQIDVMATIQINPFAVTVEPILREKPIFRMSRMAVGKS